MRGQDHYLAAQKCLAVAQESMQLLTEALSEGDADGAEECKHEITYHLSAGQVHATLAAASAIAAAGGLFAGPGTVTGRAGGDW